VWTYSIHAYYNLTSSLHKLQSPEDDPPQTYRKEELPVRIKTNTQDRKTLTEKIAVSIDPLLITEHSNYCKYSNRQSDQPHEE